MDYLEFGEHRRDFIDENSALEALLQVRSAGYPLAVVFQRDYAKRDGCTTTTYSVTTATNFWLCIDGKIRFKDYHDYEEERKPRPLKLD